MALIQREVVERLEVTEDDDILERIRVEVVDDATGDVIATSRKLNTVKPDDDVGGKPTITKGIANAVRANRRNGGQ